jgi:hypothetical protein
MGKPKVMRTLGRPGLRLENNINILRYLREIGLAGMDWIDQSQDMDQWRALVKM